MIRGNTNHFFLRYHLVTAGRIYRETRETWNQVQSEAQGAQETTVGHGEV